MLILSSIGTILVGVNLSTSKMRCRPVLVARFCCPAMAVDRRGRVCNFTAGLSFGIALNWARHILRGNHVDVARHHQYCLHVAVRRKISCSQTGRYDNDYHRRNHGRKRGIPIGRLSARSCISEILRRASPLRNLLRVSS